MTKKAIKAILKEYNISQREVAKSMGITPQTLYERLEGKDISISTLTGIAQALNISLSTLCTHIEKHIKGNTPQLDELSMLRRENELLKQIISEKDKIIDLLQQMRKSGE